MALSFRPLSLRDLMNHSLSHLIFYICRVTVCLLFLRELCNTIFLSRNKNVYLLALVGQILQVSLKFSDYCR